MPQLLRVRHSGRRGPSGTNPGGVCSCKCRIGDGPAACPPCTPGTGGHWPRPRPPAPPNDRANRRTAPPQEPRPPAPGSRTSRKSHMACPTPRDTAGRPQGPSGTPPPGSPRIARRRTPDAASVRRWGPGAIPARVEDSGNTPRLPKACCQGHGRYGRSAGRSRSSAARGGRSRSRDAACLPAGT
jgi:hypothetical protein